MNLYQKLINAQPPNTGQYIDPNGVWTYMGKVPNLATSVDLIVDGTPGTYAQFDTVGSDDHPEVTWTTGETLIFQYTAPTCSSISTSKLEVYLTPYFDIEPFITGSPEDLELSYTVGYEDSGTKDPKLTIECVLTSAVTGIPGQINKKRISVNKSGNPQSGIYDGTEPSPRTIVDFAPRWLFTWGTNNWFIQPNAVEITFTDSLVGSPTNRAGLRNTYTLADLDVARTWDTLIYPVFYYEVSLTPTVGLPLPAGTTYEWRLNGNIVSTDSTLYTYEPGIYTVTATPPNNSCPITKQVTL